MKKVAIFVATLAIAGSAMAQKYLEKKDVREMAQSMVQVYKVQKGNGLKEVEVECWKAMKRGEDGVEGGVAACSLVTLMGHVIETMGAEKEKRKVMAYWGDDAMATRMINNAKKLGVSEKTFEKVVQPELDHHVDGMSDALVKAGLGS